MTTKLLTPYFLLCFNAFLIAQPSFTNTLQLTENQTSPSATIQDVAWLAGSWKGQALGGTTEEIWSSPLGNSMMCVFKLVIDNTIRFYEIATIAEESGTLILRLKHFNQDLKGWEEKNDVLEFRLVKLDANKVYFEGFTLERPSENRMNAYVVIRSKTGKEEKTKFEYFKM